MKVALDVCSAWVEQHELTCCLIAAGLLCALLFGRAMRFLLRPRRTSLRRSAAPLPGAIAGAGKAPVVTPGGPMVSPEVFDLAETLASLEATPDRARSPETRTTAAQARRYPVGSGWEDETVNERPRARADRRDGSLSDVATIAYPRGFAITIREEKRQAHRRPTEPATNRWWRRIHPRTIARGSR